MGGCKRDIGWYGEKNSRSLRIFPGRKGRMRSCSQVQILSSEESPRPRHSVFERQSSLTTANVRLLCAKSNLQESDKVPWLAVAIAKAADDRSMDFAGLMLGPRLFVSLVP